MTVKPGQVINNGQNNFAIKWRFTILLNDVELICRRNFLTALDAKQAMRGFVRELNGEFPTDG